MGVASRAVIVVGVVLILLPIVGGAAGLLGNETLAPAIRRTPTLVLVGLFLFVVGVGLREYSSW